MELREKLKQIDSLISKGQMVKAVSDFFNDEAKTSDYGEVKTSNKKQMVEKMEGFVDAIAKVNQIQHHHSMLSGNISASEFTFDFDMKSGDKIFWHEIIRREWNNQGEIISEEYFKA